MCLGRIDKEPKKWRVGYKAFSVSKHFIYSIHFGHTMLINNGRGDFPVGKWFKDENISEIESAYPPYHKYKSGFHFYRHKKDAERLEYGLRLRVKKIRVRRIVATGEQYGVPAGVAREIFIEP